MRLNPEYRIHKLGRHYMIVDGCTGQSNLANVYSLNETAARLWVEFSDADFTKRDLVEYLCAHYDVAIERAEADVSSLLEKWSLYGFISDQSI